MNSCSHWIEHEKVNSCICCENLIISFLVCGCASGKKLIVLINFVIYTFNQRLISHLHLFFCRFLVTVAHYWGRSGSSQFFRLLGINDILISTVKLSACPCPSLQLSGTIKCQYILSLNVLFMVIAFVNMFLNLLRPFSSSNHKVINNLL